ncbi:MAG: HD domain-containing protein [Crocinitomicaceae bacterium]|nr:HD domain-containing protein [Crocinitomicaceae bacterium]
MVNTLIEKVQKHIQEQFETMEGSHDWFHIERVLKMSQFIQSKEGGDFELISLTALLHDIADHKYNNYNFEIGATKAFDLLMSEGANQELAEKVASLINIISFKGGDVSDQETSLEGKIVKSRPLFNPDISPIMHATKEEYAKSKSHTVNHFYEKLLLLKDRMETNTAKEIAEKRHEIMLKFLEEFQKEWSLTV